MRIGKREIGAGHKPFIIAEMSNNHNRDFDYAMRFVEEAANAGADALKLQSYTADIITMDVKTEPFYIGDEKSLWHGQYLYDLYKDASMPWDWHEPLMKRAAELGIECFSSPFGDEAVDLLENLNAPAYKIASFEITHLPLIRRCAQTGKPVIISTGMATLDEIEEAVQAVRDAGGTQIALLKCTSNYPADARDANLATIPDLKARFPDVEIGLSDHSLGTGVAVASVVYGATIIEKHFIVDRARGGLDAAFSMDPQEFKTLCEETERAWRAGGHSIFGGTQNEQRSQQFRQSLWISADAKAGDVLTADNLKICRPNVGLAPKFYDQMLGKELLVDCPKGTPLTDALVR